MALTSDPLGSSIMSASDPTSSLPFHQRVLAFLSTTTPSASPTTPSPLHIQLDDDPSHISSTSSSFHKAVPPPHNLPSTPTIPAPSSSSSPSPTTSPAGDTSASTEQQLIPSSSKHLLLPSSIPAPAQSTSVQSLSQTLHQLLHFTAHQHAEQASVNSNQNTLHAFHFLVHYAHLSQTRALQRRQQSMLEQLEVGKRLLSELVGRLEEAEGQVRALELEVGGLGEEVKEQKDKCARLSAQVEVQKEVVRQGMELYEQRMQQQELQLQAQEHKLERLLLVRFRLDAGVDAAILAAAFYLSRLRVLHLLFQLLASRTVPSSMPHSRTKREALTGAGQLLLFAFLVQRARTWAVDNGIHHTIGSYSAYGQWMLTTLQAACFRAADKHAQPQQPASIPSHAEASKGGQSGGDGVAMAVVKKEQEEEETELLPPPPYEGRRAEDDRGTAGVVLSAAGDVVGGALSGVSQAMVEAARLVGSLLTFDDLQVHLPKALR